MPKAIDDLTGRRFGRLVVLNREANNKHGRTTWRCKCDCGAETIVCRCELISGDTKSCGCYWRERIALYNKTEKKTHGLYGTRIYVVWKDMVYRCEKPYISGYQDYGGRGIKVCEEWHDVAVFADWAYKNGYSDTEEKGECTIERKDVNGDYEPSNCYFTNMFEQNCNRRNTVKVEHENRLVPLMRLCKEENVKHTYVYWAIHQCGKTIEEALKMAKLKGKTYQPYCRKNAKTAKVSDNFM